MRAAFLLPLVVSAACRTVPPPASPEVTVSFLGSSVVDTSSDRLVGGLSDWAYDGTTDRYAALSDDPSEHAPARFYWMRVPVADGKPGVPVVEEAVTLKGPDGQPFPLKGLDPEGLALLGRDRVLVSSEGVTSRGIPPFVGVFGRADGAWQAWLPLPAHFTADAAGDAQTRGVRENYGLEALSLCPDGRTLLALNESPLSQELPAPALPQPLRVLRWDVGGPAPRLVDERLYAAEPVPAGMLVHGVTAALCLDERRALVLERSWSRELGFLVRLYLADFSAADAVPEDVVPAGRRAAGKRLLVDLGTLGIRMDNFEGLALGPRLPDGRRSLLVISDDNFLPEQVTEVLLFAVSGV